MSLPFLRSLRACAVVCLALVTNAFAATFLVDGYAMRVWQTEDGLPQNIVTSIAQTRDGYLWLGTHSGVARFDGERFRVFDSVNTPGLQDRRITGLFEDADGALWITHETGGITRHANGRFETVAPPAAGVREKIIGVGADESRRLWVMRENGALDEVETGRRVPSPIGQDLPGVMAWARNAHGNIWVAENGSAYRLEDGALKQLTFDPARVTGYVLSIAGSADGGVWVLRDSRIRKWDNGRWTEDRGIMPWPPGPIMTSLELRDGTLAVATVASGLFLIFPDGRPHVHFNRSNGLPQTWVRTLYEDREGNLWAGIGSGGMVSIHRTAFGVLNAPDQWQGCSVLSTAPGRDGALWAGTEGGGLYRHADGNWTHYGGSEGLDNGFIYAIAEDADGDVWAGNHWWGGPYRLENGRFVRAASLDDRAPAVFALVPIPGSDEVLVGNREGLLQLKGGQSNWLLRARDSSAGAVCAIARDRNGVIWCGFAEDGLVRIAEGKVTRFRRADGLGSDSVQCLHIDELDRAVWIGTADNGLTRFKDGRFTHVRPSQGLADKVVGALVDDGQGYFWLSTHHGLQRVAKDELSRCADGLIPAISGRIYDESDGLPTVEFTGGLQAAASRSPDGRLWFASSKGVISVDPSRIERNSTLPPVVLESLLVDGQPVAPVNGVVPSRLRPSHERLEFRFSGLSFVAPKQVQFKYRLEGIDNAWIDAGSKRTAFYSRLPAGEYRFRVIASNNDGMWNTVGATVAFSVAPFFWQEWWFISAAGLVLAAAVALFARAHTRRRMQRQLEELRRQHEIERERARIAQDIHDDVGSSLSRIAMLSQPGPGDFEQPGRTAATLARIYTTAREVTRSLDEIVWAVDPRHDTLDSLVDYMGKFAQDFLAAANVRCRLDFPVEVPAWPLIAEARHSLFLAFKEALNNAVKHAGASEVRVSLTLDARSFALVVNDNGRGFDPAQSRSTDVGRISSGNGLANMKRRLARIGGRCEISSSPGAGTRVSLIMEVTEHEPVRAADL